MLKLLVIGTLLLPSQDGGGKDTSYVKYETENVAKYRAVPDFKVPSGKGAIKFSTTNATPTVARMLPEDSLGVYVQRPEQLARLQQIFVRHNCDMKKAHGFRIQIFAGGDLQNANKIRADFLEVYDEMSVHLDWKAPTFTVRVGDFLTRSDAMRNLADVRQMFPDAFIVGDMVLLPKYRELLEEQEDDDLGAQDDMD